jgi:hypothetical protein
LRAIARKPREISTREETRELPGCILYLSFRDGGISFYVRGGSSFLVIQIIRGFNNDREWQN